MSGPADLFLNFGASIARDLVWGAIREARYCCCFNNFVEDLNKEKEELQKNKKSVDEIGKRAKRKIKIRNDVKDWLEEADKLEKQVEKLEAKVEKYKSCCLGRCPNWICRYLLGRQLKIKKDNVKLHCDKRPRDIERVPTITGMEHYSSKDFMRFKSRELAHGQLMEAIQDDGVSMIGLYGMGGSGKTTLAKEVGKEAQQLFNYKVVFVVVSREGVRRIQDKIASSLELPLDEKEEIDRAKRLSMRLRNSDERFLIILEDVWEKPDFEAIGISFGENRKGCKVLMTTRHLSVCNLMDCQKTIPLSLLSFKESWDLFQKHAQFSDETSKALKEMAKKITEKCDGLPVAIAAVASTLKGKTQVEWEVVLKDLKDSRPMDIEEGLQDPYKCLELSYNNLQSREAKSLFLLCSIFPENWEIKCQNLFLYGIGLGLFRGVSSYAMARKQASVAKSKLINSCLLLEAKDDEGFECVKMHDLVRDVALLLAKKENKTIMRIKKEENYLEEDSITEGTQIKYLWCDKFPNKQGYTELELVIFCSDSESVRVPCEFFERKKKLRIMVLVNEGSKKVLQLPDSIQALINLRCLVLRGWELGDISFLGNLKGLESLTLENCTFHELPNAIEQLTKLSILSVSECEIAKDPCDVIGRCSQLEDLYFTKNMGFDWKFDNEIAAEFLDKLNIPKRLQNYSIQIGEMTREFHTAKGYISRSLVVEYFDASTSNATIKDLVKRTECLSLGHIKGGCKNIIPDIIGGGMTELIDLVLHDSEEIESLIDTTNLQCQVGTLFSKLSNLRIGRMKHLVTLCRALPSPAIFEKLEELCVYECDQLHGVLFDGKLDLSNLKVLELWRCPKLTSLCTPHSVQSLLQLQHLKIEECSELKHIITEEMKEEIIEDDNDQRTNQLPFQKLKRIIVRSCIQLKYTIPVSYARGLVQLERMEIAAVNELKFLFGQYSHANQLADAAENDFLVKLPVLKRLELSGLPNIVSIFPENYYPVWPSLHELRLNNCPQYSIMSLNMCVVGSEVKQHCGPTKDLNELSYKSLVKLEINGLERIKSVLSACSMKSMPQLEELRIDGCNQLEQIIASEEHHNIMNSGTESCSKSSSNCCTLHSGSLDLCNLKRLQLHDCPMLRSLFTLSIARTLTSLERLEVSNCHGLKEIIENDSNLQSHDSMFPKLKDLYIRNCNSLECIFLVSFTQGLMQLKKISILNAPQLQYLFGEGSLGHHSSHQYQNIIQFELPILEDLTLEKLPNLISICPNNYHAICSSLQNITLEHVGLSNSTTNNLKGGSEDRHWGCTSTKDLRATIMKLMQNSEEYIIEKENDLLLLRDMGLRNQHEIMYLCISPKRLLNLQNLLELRVEGCEKLKAMFSVSVLRSLPQLKALLVIECEELEQITIEDEENENLATPYSQKGCFAQLEVLIIKCCNKLKRLFSISTSREFPKLEYLFIKEASHLEEVFESEKCETEERKEVVLSELKYLFLAQLPILTHVWQGMQTVTCHVVQNCPKLFLTIAPQKSFEELHMEIKDNFYNHRKDLTRELRHILLKIIEETYDEDPMLKSEVSDFGDEAASWSKPPSSQIIEEKGKEIVGYGSASKAPAIATSSIDVHELMDEQSISEPTLLDQQLALGEPKLTTKVPQEIISSHQSVEAIPHETAKEIPTSKEAVITTLSDDIALPIGPLPKVSTQEPMNERSETIMTNQQDFGEMTSYIHSNASHNGVSEEIQEDLPIKKADTMTSLTDLEPGSFTSLHKSSPQNIEAVVKESAQEGPSFEEATIPTLSNDLAPVNSPPAESLVIGPLEKASPLSVVDGVQEQLPKDKAKTLAPSSQIILMKQQATEGNEITKDSFNSLFNPAQNEPKLKIVTLAKSITSQERPQIVSDANSPDTAPVTHVDVEDLEVLKPALDQPQQIVSPLPVLSAALTPSDIISSYQPQSITMPLSSGQTFEELIHFSRPELTLPAPGSIPNFELDPLDELELLLTDSSFSTSTDTAPFRSLITRPSIQKMVEDLDALFDKEVDDLYNDPVILERLAQISSIFESMTESDAPSTFVDFMKNFRFMYPQLLNDFEKNKKAILEYEKAKTEKDNMAAEIPKIRGKKKELEDNIRRAEFADETFSDQIAELKRQLVEVESRARVHKMVLSSLHQDRTKMDLNTRAVVEKAKKITQFIHSNSSVYTENHVNLASLRNRWSALKSQFVQSRRGL